MNVNIIDTPGKLSKSHYTYNIVHSSHVKGMGGTLFIELLYLPVLGAPKGIICPTNFFFNHLGLKLVRFNLFHLKLESKIEHYFCSLRMAA